MLSVEMLYGTTTVQKAILGRVSVRAHWNARKFVDSAIKYSVMYAMRCAVVPRGEYNCRAGMGEMRRQEDCWRRRLRTTTRGAV